jgi:hypothetical protein
METTKTEAQWLVDRKRIRSIITANRGKEDSVIYMFLDFDGVINIFLLEGTPEYEKALEKREFDFANRDCVKRLNRLCRDYPMIKVIVSSSWRYAGLPYCQDYLEKAGMDPSIRLADMTDPVTMLPREEHITEYLFDHPDFRGFIILDDMKMKHLNDYLVQTDCLVGWNDERDDCARKILQKYV